MIDLYYWTTPNGHKITMFLEETTLPYRIMPVDIGKGAQFDPAFLAISPNNRIPEHTTHGQQRGVAADSLWTDRCPLKVPRGGSDCCPG
jgi:GSH-dependent disulfide-bond oxidoreductase